jgi:hypothetical protein
MTTTPVVLTNESTRRVLISALWRVAAHDLGEQFDDEIYGCAYIPMDWDAAAVIDARIAALKLTLADIELAREAEVGGPAGAFGAPARDAVDIELSVSPDRLADEVDGWRDHIKESDDLWKTSPEERAAMIAQYDAATALLQQLPTPAEAVAR